MNEIIQAKKEIEALNIRNQIHTLLHLVENIRETRVADRNIWNTMIVDFWDGCLDLAEQNQQDETRQ